MPSPEMNPANSEETLFASALDLPPARRATFLDQACAGDVALRQQVEALLKAHDEAGELLEPPPTEINDPSAPTPPSNEPIRMGPGGTKAVAKITEQPGDAIGRYKLMEQVGEGGFGVVYVAEQREPVKRRVALKVIKLGMDTRQVVARFEAERQALALMDHPNIAKVFDAGSTETGRPYFVMELVRGIPITTYCDQNNLPTRERLELCVKVCHAIQHAHQKGIIHRDIKPSNILVTVNDGVAVPKVIDFGIAKATQGELTDKTIYTQFQQFIGTPAYTSPEQAEMTSLDIDTRSDIYSLGVLLYELLTGTTPFDSKKLLAGGLDEMRRTIREREPVRPSTRVGTLQGEELSTTAKRRNLDPRKLVGVLRGDLDWIVMKALEKDRTRRYETANGLAADIRRHLNNEPVTACPPSAAYVLAKLVGRHKMAVAAAAAVGAALVLGAAVSTWQAVRATRAENRADEEKVTAIAERDRARRAEKNASDERASAIEARKRADSEAAKSGQVASFMKEMLTGVGPSVAMGRDTTMLREILDKTAKRVGKDLKGQPEVEAELRDTIAGVYSALGMHDKAEAILREAVAIRRKLADKNNRYANSLYRFSFELAENNKWIEAESSAREALAMYRKLQGDEHPDDPVVAMALDRVAGALRGQGRLREAESLQREALATWRKVAGDTHPFVACMLHNLALIVSSENRLDEAEALYREALEEYEKEPGNEPLSTATSLVNLASVVERRGDLVESETLLRKAVAIRRKFLGEKHPEFAKSLNDLVVILEKQGRFAEAETACRESLDLARKHNEAGTWPISDALVRLVAIKLKEQRFAEADPFARECLAIRDRISPSDWRTSVARSQLGGVLLGKGKYSEAEPLLLSGYQALNQFGARLPAVSMPRLREALERLPLLYSAWGNPEKAADWKQKLADFEKSEASNRAPATARENAK